MPLNDYSRVDLSPQGLTKEERENPCKVIDDFFSFTHLPHARQMLWDLISTTVSGNFCKLTRSERSDMVFLYEKIKKLIEAISLIKRDFGESYENWKEKMEDYIKRSAPEAD
jgi:hypothetical protein